MRVVRYRRYGPPEVLRIEEVAEPVPGAGEAKVRVHAVALNPLDWKIRAGHLRLLPMLRLPRGSGCDFAGEVVAVGGGATARHVGERVLGSLAPFRRDGALAQFVVERYERLIPIPPAIDDGEAAALPIAGGTALQALVDQAMLRAGERVLIVGAAGGVGHLGVQIARHRGAHVAGVCSAANVGFVRDLGADEVIDYGTQDFTTRKDEFDVVFDAAGASSFDAARRVLTPAGRYLNTGGDIGAVVQTIASGALARFGSRQRALVVALKNHPARWVELLDLLRTGALRVHVDRVIDFEQIADAHRAMETGHGRGKIVVRIA